MIPSRPSLRRLLHTTIFSAVPPNRHGTPRNNTVEGARKIRFHLGELLPKNQVSVNRELIEKKNKKYTTINLRTFFYTTMINAVSYHRRGTPRNNTDEGTTQNLLSSKRIAD